MCLSLLFWVLVFSYCSVFFRTYKITNKQRRDDGSEGGWGIQDNPSRRCGQPWYFSPDQQAVTLARVSRRCRRESGSVPNEALFLWNNTLWHRANFSHRPSSTIQLKYKDPASRVRDLTQLPKEELQLVSPNLLCHRRRHKGKLLSAAFLTSRKYFSRLRSKAALKIQLMEWRKQPERCTATDWRRPEVHCTTF